jgi:hypothetical protein
MTLPIRVIIPWRTEPTRQAGFEWLLRYYLHRFGDGSVHVQMDDGRGPFNKSRLINDAVGLFPGHVCVISDADAFICDWTLREALRLAGTGNKLILPHYSVCRMTRDQSRRVLRWDPADPVSGKLYRHQRTRACPGGLWVVHADLFNRHRMDERFEGWGCEDTEFLRRIPWRRLPGPLFHIWHAKASKERLKRNRQLLGVAKGRG